MNNIIWNLFLQTGNVETYLLLKQLEKERDEDELLNELTKDEIAFFESKM